MEKEAAFVVRKEFGVDGMARVFLEEERLFLGRVSFALLACGKSLILSLVVYSS